MTKQSEMWEIADIEGLVDDLLESTIKLYPSPKDQYAFIQIVAARARTTLDKYYYKNSKNFTLPQNNPNLPRPI